MNISEFLRDKFKEAKSDSETEITKVADKKNTKLILADLLDKVAKEIENE
jgi:hypothetical protein